MHLNRNLFLIVFTLIVLSSCSTSKHGIPYLSENGQLWGIKDSLTHKVNLQPQYHFLRKTAYSNRFIATDSLGQFTLVNQKGKPLVESSPRLIRLVNSHYALIDNTRKKELIELKHCKSILPPLYNSIEFVKENRLRVGLDGKYGIVDLNHKTILPIQYNSIEVVGDQYKVGIHDKYGVVNQEGEVIIPLKFNRINYHQDFNGYELFLEDLVAPATTNGKIGQWVKGDLSGFNKNGFIYTKLDDHGEYEYYSIYNKDLERLTPAEIGYTEYNSELNGYTRTDYETGNSFFISTTGEKIQYTPELLSSIKYCKNKSCVSQYKNQVYKLSTHGHEEKLPYSDVKVGAIQPNLMVKQGDYWGCVTWDNKTIIPFTYKFITYKNRHELYYARTDTKVDYYETSGKLRAQFKVDRSKNEQVELLDEAYFKVRKNGKWALFSPTGKPLTNFVFDELKSSNSICLGRINNTWSFVTLDGTILSEQFDVIHPFAENREGKYNYTYRVQQGNLFGLYNHKGEMILPVDYQNVFLPSEGLIAVSKGEKWGFVNYRNELLIPFLYDKGRAFHNGRARVEVNREKVWINKKGKKIVVE